MQIETISISSSLKRDEIKLMENSVKVLFKPYTLPEIIISPIVDSSRLAYYDKAADAIIFKEDFALSSDEYSLRNVLLHELSHALQYRKDGFTDHGEGFHAYCRLLGCDPEFSKARIKLKEEKRESYARKVEKLLALSSSPYEEESRSAILKAEELMAAHGLEYAFKKDKEEKLYHLTLSEKGRFTLSEKKLYALIRNITGVFLIYEAVPYERRRKASIYGNLEQVETALYLYTYLSSELERSLRKEKKEKKGESFSPESFKLGLVTGLYEKIEKENAEASRAIILSTEKNQSLFLSLTGMKIRTSAQKSYAHNSLSDYSRGLEHGKRINIPRKSSYDKGIKQIESL